MAEAGASGGEGLESRGGGGGGWGGNSRGCCDDGGSCWRRKSWARDNVLDAGGDVVTGDLDDTVEAEFGSSGYGRLDDVVVGIVVGSGMPKEGREDV